MREQGDSELVAAAQQGDREALERLLRLHQPRLHAVCRRITGNDADALDATQEALMALVRGLPRFDGRSTFATWAYRVATNASLDELRRRRRRPVLDGGPEPTETPSPTPDPAATAVDQIEVDRALATLPETLRAAVVLRDLCQLDYAEIAEVLSIPPGTVRSRIARGRAAVAAALASDDEPPSGGNQLSGPERPTTEPHPTRSDR